MMDEIEPIGRIVIGTLTLEEGYGGRDKIAITQADGEGGDFPVAAVEAVLQAFYKENF